MVAAYESQRHELAGVWAEFYPAAHAFAWGLCAGHRWSFDYAGVTGPIDYADLTGRIADCIAALSPQVAWDYNMTLAARAVTLYAGGDRELRGLGGQTRANVKNAASALNGTGPGKGPKVNAFARNIRGDWTVVCVDRHMLTAAGYDDKRPTNRTRADVARRVTIAADRFDLMPATMQALIWGWHRYTKGYMTYYNQEDNR
jgi:hypothetical protein